MHSLNCSFRVEARAASSLQHRGRRRRVHRIHSHTASPHDVVDELLHGCVHCPAADALVGGEEATQLDTERVGGTWQGPVFVLTHHPEDAQPADCVTFLSSDVAGAVRIGLEAAGGKNLEVFSPTIGRQLVERGLIDEIDLHIAPVFGSANQLRGEFLG